MTPERLAQLRQVAEAATEGPWNYQPWSTRVYALDKPRATATVAHMLNQTDAEFIATFNPATARELLDENERLRARLAAVEELHPIVKVYDECDHENCTAEPIELSEFPTCADSLLGYACGTCCQDSGYYALEECPHGLDHTGTTRTTYCPTVVAVRGE